MTRDKGLNQAGAESPAAAGYENAYLFESLHMSVLPYSFRAGSPLPAVIRLRRLSPT